MEQSWQVPPVSYRLCGTARWALGPGSPGPACSLQQDAAGCQLLACGVLAAPDLSKRAKGRPYSYITVTHSLVYRAGAQQGASQTHVIPHAVKSCVV